MVTSTLKVKRFSSSDIFEIKKVCNSEETLQEEHINGMVARICDRKEQRRQDRISEFLAPRGPFSSFKYPDRQDILNVPYCDILSTISTTTVMPRSSDTFSTLTHFFGVNEFFFSLF
jgi:hypothetical protein